MGTCEPIAIALMGFVRRESDGLTAANRPSPPSANRRHAAPQGPNSPAQGVALVVLVISSVLGDKMRCSGISDSGTRLRMILTSLNLASVVNGPPPSTRCCHLLCQCQFQTYQPRNHIYLPSTTRAMPWAFEFGSFGSIDFNAARLSMQYPEPSKRREVFRPTQPALKNLAVPVFTLP